MNLAKELYARTLILEERVKGKSIEKQVINILRDMEKVSLNGFFRAKFIFEENGLSEETLEHIINEFQEAGFVMHLNKIQKHVSEIWTFFWYEV